MASSRFKKKIAIYYAFCTNLDPLIPNMEIFFHSEHFFYFFMVLKTLDGRNMVKY